MQEIIQAHEVHYINHTTPVKIPNVLFTHTTLTGIFEVSLLVNDTNPSNLESVTIFFTTH
jgi:hypothetical protein